MARRRLLAVKAFPGLTAADNAHVLSWLPTVLRSLRDCCQVRVDGGRYWAA